MKKVVIVVIMMILITFQNLSSAKTIYEARIDLRQTKGKILSKFKDLNKGDWYLDNISILADLGIVDGYKDGTFKPQKMVTRAQFIKMVISSLGYRDLQSGSDYWAEVYIAEAMKFRLIGVEEIKREKYDKEINRGEMSQIIVNAIGDSYDIELNEGRERLKDFESINNEYKEAVLIAYSKGILKGYPDGEFKSNKFLTRSEAVTIIVRMLDLTDKEEEKNEYELTGIEEESLPSYWDENDEKNQVSRVQKYDLQYLKEQAIPLSDEFNIYDITYDKYSALDVIKIKVDNSVEDEMSWIIIEDNSGKDANRKRNSWGKIDIEDGYKIYQYPIINPSDKNFDENWQKFEKEKINYIFVYFPFMKNKIVRVKMGGETYETE